ncbi:MAG: hypothetical protein AAGC95_14005 [Pseudomonadota bacterium]
MTDANAALDPLALAGAKAKGKRPYFFKDPDVERVLNITMAVAGEVAVLRQRLDTVERLLDRNGAVTRADIEAFSPSPAESDERGQWTQEYVARILRIVQQENEAIAKGAEESSEDVAEELAQV